MGGDLQRLQEISTRLIQEGDVEGLYRELIDAAVYLAHADHGTMQSLDEETGELCLLATRNMPQEVWNEYGRLSPEANTSCAEALRLGERVIVDYVSDERIAGTEDARVHLEAGIRAAQSTPLVARSGRTLGMISTHWNEPHTPSELQPHLLDLLARQAADLIERTQAEQDLKEANARLEQRVAERTAELERQAEQLRRLTRELITAEQRERRRLSQTLHDHVQQLLAATKMKIGMATGLIDERGARDPLQAAAEHLEQAIDDTRTLSHELSPPGLYNEGIVPTLQWLGRRMQEHHGLHLEVHSEAVPGTLSADMRTFVFQAVRELVFNVVKHARTDQARVSLRGDERRHQLEVTVEDDGKGCDPETVLRTHDAGFGLLSLRERLDGLDGELDLRSRPGGGCRVAMRLPLEPLDADAAPDTRDDAAQTPHRDAGPAADPSRTLRVLLVDDHLILRDGLVQLLMNEPTVEVVGEAADGQEAIEAVEQLSPEVVLMDVAMPGMDGIEATRRIRRRWPNVRVVGLSMNDSGSTASLMLEAGAEAHLAKSEPAETVVAALRGRTR